MNYPRRHFIKKLLKGTLPVFVITSPGLFLKGKTLEKKGVFKRDKSMIIKEIKHEGALDISVADSLLESQAKFKFIKTINWPEYSYKPKVKFKIAHCQRHILLKY